MTGHRCMRCGAGLTGDEIALHKKMISRGAEEFWCLDCLAAECSTTREKLERLIAFYHRTGICTLFVKYEQSETA